MWGTAPGCFVLDVKGQSGGGAILGGEPWECGSFVKIYRIGVSFVEMRITWVTLVTNKRFVQFFSCFFACRDFIGEVGWILFMCFMEKTCMFF